MILLTGWLQKVMYEIAFSSLALKGVAKLRKSEPASYKKLVKILEELKVHPTTGTGHPEQLKGMSVPAPTRAWSGSHHWNMRGWQKQKSRSMHCPGTWS